MSNKYEQLVEYIINDETDKARELFHEIVVEKSRDIYESLIEDEDLEETIGGNQVEELVDEVSLDEQGLSEEEDEEGEEFEFGGDDAEGEEEFGGDELGGEEGEGDIEDRVLDLEAALDELKAEFDELMAGEEHEEEEFPGIHGDEGEEEAAPEEFFEGEDCDDEEEDEEEDLDESIVREYVEKVATPGNSEGAAVGTGKSVSVNSKSTVAGKNPLGAGSASGKNLVKGGAEANPDGTSPNSSVKPKGDLVSNPQNKPGANAGKSAFKTKEASTGSEGKLAGADGSRPVNKTSVIKTTVR